MHLRRGGRAGGSCCSGFGTDDDQDNADYVKDLYKMKENKPLQKNDFFPNKL